MLELDTLFSFLSTLAHTHADYILSSTTIAINIFVWCRASEFDKISSAPFELKTTDQQTAMNGTFTVATTMCNITYVTSTRYLHVLLCLLYVKKYIYIVCNPENLVG